MAEPEDGCAVEIRQGNIDNDHIPISPAKNIFPADAFGGVNNASAGKPITVTLVPGNAVEPDIVSDKGILRIRGSSVRDFYQTIGATDGTRLFLREPQPRAFRMSAIR